MRDTRWDCKYHVVFIPKKRKKNIFKALRRQLGEIFRDLAKQKELHVVKGHLMEDQVDMCLSIPRKSERVNDIETSERIIRAVCEILGWACGARWALDAKNDTMRCAETWGVAAQSTLTIVRDLCGPALTNQIPLLDEGLEWFLAYH